MTRSKSDKLEKRQKSLIILSFLSGAIVMFLLLKSISLFTGENDIPISGQSNNGSLSSAIKKINEATVLIETYNRNVKSSSGSGFIYKIDSRYAYILTNEHVIEEKNIKITTSSDETVDGKLLGKDAYIDLAVVRIDKKYAKKVAHLGKSEKSEVGDIVFTVGSPVGENYQGSVSSGIISGKNRMVQTTAGSTKADNSWLMSVLQFDAAINPGNSGGPLVNTNGEVIGIVTMKLIKEEIEGMGFAIPIEHAIENIDSLEQGKEINWPELGISMVNVSGDTSSYKGIVKPKNINEGVIVLAVETGSSADDASLKRGDIITEVDGNKIKNTAYLKYELFKHQVGDKITITYLRDGKEKKTTVKLNSSSN